MTKRTHFMVNVRGEVAKFSGYKQAMLFADYMSRKGDLVEVRDKSGIVGQYQNGVSTPEFRQHHATLENL